MFEKLSSISNPQSRIPNQFNPSSRAIRLGVHIQGQGFPILCLHGHPGSGGCMSTFTEHLSQKFQTLAPDLRGYGNSRAGGDFQMSDHLLDLEALLESCHIDQCLVLGWSLGGILALELALRHPQKVSGLILIATAARPRSNHPPVSWQDNFYTGLASILNRLQPGWQWNIDMFGKRSLYRYLLQQHTPRAYEYLAFEAMPAYLQTSSAATRALTKALRAGYNRLEDLKQIQCPSLMLVGAADRHITPESSRETAQFLKDCELHCYPDTAHLLPWEIPSQLLHQIDYWLNQHHQVVTASKNL